MTRTFTRVHNAVTFADPYKQCLRCNGWIDGFLDVGAGPYLLVPCGHCTDYRDVCPSWGPVDGCTCQRAHAVRVPTRGDDRRY